jgi:hypothetical protein
MADIDLTQLDEMVNPSEFDGFGKIKPEYKQGLLGAAATYGIYKTGAELGKSLLDTQGYGNFPGAPKKYIHDSKTTQLWSNAMQASKSKTRLGAIKEITHSGFTGYPLELKAAKSSIAEVDDLLTNPNLDAQTKANYELEKKSRVKNLSKRRGLLSNHYRALGTSPENLPFNVSDDFKSTTIKVDKTLVKLDPSMKSKLGKRVLATKHTGGQISDFRGFATRDARVRNIRNLMENGKVSEAQKAAKNAHYLRKGKVIIPDKINGIPVNRGKEQMGMKLRKMTNKVKYKGEYRPVYRLGFVPKIPQNMSSKLEYVTGQHWQYMDFVKTNGGYHRFRGGMRDVHNLVPHKLGKIAGKAETAFAKPIVNFSDWKYNIITKAKKIGKKADFSKSLYMTKGYRGKALSYGKSESASRIAKILKKLKGSKALKIAKFIATKGRKW